MADERVQFLLTEDRIPTHWVNIAADLPGDPLPPLSPRTGEPAGPEDLTPIFPMGIIEQEVAQEPLVEIPEEVREAYKLRSEEHTSELQSRQYLVCRLLLEKKKKLH